MPKPQNQQKKKKLFYYCVVIVIVIAVAADGMSKLFDISVSKSLIKSLLYKQLYLQYTVFRSMRYQSIILFTIAKGQQFFMCILD
jgi:hypothetical protein